MENDRNNKNNGFIEEKLYSPIFVKIRADENLEYYDEIDYYDDPLSQQSAVYYFDEIHTALLKEQLAFESERGLMEYFSYPGRNSSVDDKVYSLFVDVEIHGEKLWGVATVQLTEPLTQDEYDDLKDYISGQYSDGFGEGFEQREIRTEDGELYVSLWDSCDEFFIDSHTKFSHRTGLDYLLPELGNSVFADIPIMQKAETLPPQKTFLPGEIDVADLKKQLVYRAFQNWKDFRNTPQESTPDSLYHDAVKVIGCRDAYQFIKNYGGYTAEQLTCLLQFTNPVELVGDYLDPGCDISIMPGILENIIDEQEKLKRHYALANDTSAPESKASNRKKGLDVNEKPSLIAQLREAQQAAQDKPMSPREPQLRNKVEPEL